MDEHYEQNYWKIQAEDDAYYISIGVTEPEYEEVNDDLVQDFS